jgi:hypothetical protein
MANAFRETLFVIPLDRFGGEVNFLFFTLIPRDIIYHIYPVFIVVLGDQDHPESGLGSDSG